MYFIEPLVLIYVYVISSYPTPVFHYSYSDLRLFHRSLQLYLNWTFILIKIYYLWLVFTNFSISPYTRKYSDFRPPKYCHRAYGTMYNKNTIEEFKSIDKNGLIKMEGLRLLEDFKNDNILHNPGSLIRFILLSFAVSNSTKVTSFSKSQSLLISS